MKESSWRLMCRLVPSLMVRKVSERSVRWAICLVRRLRVTLLCLADGYPRLEVRGAAKHLWYSTQMKGAPRRKLDVSSHIMAVAVLFQSLNLCLIVLDCFTQGWVMRILSHFTHCKIRLKFAN